MQSPNIGTSIKNSFFFGLKSEINLMEFMDLLTCCRAYIQLAKTTGGYNLSRRKVIEVIRHPDNINRDAGLYLGRGRLSVLINKQLTKKHGQMASSI